MGDSEDFDMNNGVARNIMELTRVSYDLTNKLQNLNENEKVDVIISHIQKYTESKIPMVDFESGLEWFNVSRTLSIDDLKGHICILDFFTYCCINCIHILPDLEALEHIHPPTNGQVIVIGVHSAKFENERVSDNIKSAILRHNIKHPVVNDSKGDMWHKLSISCWPTLLILGPYNNPLFVLLGEGHRQTLQLYINNALNYYSNKGSLKNTPLPLCPSSHILKSSPLLFPGKICTYPDGFIISDSGHNRILLVNFDGHVMKVIGSGQRGYNDGNFNNCSFNNPQGIIYQQPNMMFVADTDNHCIRQVNMTTQKVTTVAGTGQQGTDKEGGNMTTKQCLSSPWDVCLVRTIDRELTQPQNLLLIAMAGTHQIWGLFLDNGQWLKTICYRKGAVVRLAGSGNEENRNTSYPLKCGFAQPSGLSLNTQSQQQEVFIADAESSTIRRFTLNDGTVKGVIGGARDPSDLFAYGDCDGVGVNGKLQHPLGVVCVDGDVYIADTYNHKIKVVKPSGKSYSVATVAGGNTELNEPGGICVSNDGKMLYIADTNNHAIKTINLNDNNNITNFEIHMIDESDSPRQHDYIDSDNIDADNIDVDDITTISLPSGNSDIIIVLNIELRDEAKLNTDAPNKWNLSSKDGSVSPSKGKIESNATEIPLKTPGNDCDIILCCSLYICLDSGVCVFSNIKKCLQFRYNDTLVHNDGQIKVDVSLKPSIPSL